MAATTVKSFAEVFRTEELAFALSSWITQGDVLNLRVVTRRTEPTIRVVASKLPRRFYKVRQLSIFGGTGPPSLNSVEGFDLASGRWETLPPMPIRRYGHAVAVVSCCVYVCGGSGGEPPLRDVICFHSSSGEWKNLPPMPVQRIDFAAVALDEWLYVLGGAGNPKGSGHPLSSVSRINVNTPNSWEMLPSMATGRVGLGAATMGKLLYVCGGMDKSGKDLKSVERFDSMAKCWKQLPEMSAARSGLAVSTLGNCIFVCGGKVHGRATSSMECFHPGLGRLGRWETLPPMITRRCRFAFASHAGRLFACGGEDSTGRALSAAECYLPERRCWQPLPPMQVARARVVAVSAPILQLQGETSQK